MLAEPRVGAVYVSCSMRRCLTFTLTLQVNGTILLLTNVEKFQECYLVASDSNLGEYNGRLCVLFT